MRALRAISAVALVSCGASHGVAPPPGLGLSLGVVVPGQVATFTVTGADPFERVVVAGSQAGPGSGPCPTPLGGQCLGIRQATVLGSAIADGNGLATLDVSVPGGLTTLWAQAAVGRGGNSLLSPVRSSAVRDVSMLSAGDLVITEFLKDPTVVADAVGEWFEVYNPGPSAIDLGGLVVEDDDTDGFTVQGIVVVPAGEYAVFGVTSDLGQGVAVDVVWSSFNLGNSGDEIVLRAPGGVVDAVRYDDGVDWLDLAGSAVALSDGTLDAVSNDLADAWCEATRVFGGGDRGTPGADNIDCGGPQPQCLETRDADGDGWRACDECDDHDPRTRPGAPEVCDGIDNDCDGVVPVGERDLDLDGLPDCDPCVGSGYASARGSGSPGALYNELQALSGVLHDCASYEGARDYLYEVLDQDADGMVTDVYTGDEVYVGDGPIDFGLINTEHSWPQSQGTDTNPARCDLHHLYPVDPIANIQRSNLPFGEVVSGVTWSEGGSTRGQDAGGSTVFEPPEGHKGNVARSMLHVHTRHGLSLSSAQIDLIQLWSAADPVDLPELQRSLVIATEQGGANPYVVCPEFVDGL